MTDHAKKHFQRRRKSLFNIRRKKVFPLLALILILGSGAFLFHKEKLYAISEVLTWLKQNRPDKALAPIQAASPRGEIYDRNFRRLAATYETYAIYARPLEMEDPAASAGLLEETLGLGQNKLSANLKSERGFVWIAKGIDQSLADSIKKRNIKGVYQVVETKRFYPNHETAAHAVGFVENDQGLDGIEFQYNTLLRGDEINSAELEALHFSSASELSRTGTHLVLNLDLMLQSKIESFLEKRVKITGAESGAVLLMDANTGGILAMASYPAFNPNRYWEFSSSALNNNVVTEPLYPGELALIFQQAAAINFKNERKPQTLDNMDEAESLRVIKPETFKRKEFSVAPPVDNVDPEYLVHFAQLLGLGQEPVTDIPLKDEASITSSLALTDPAFHSSALRLLTGFTALMNNGKIVSPHLLNKAYPKENPTPVEPTLTGAEQTASLHPDTSKDLIDFLAAKWLKIYSRGRIPQVPMFFEAHRLAVPPENSGQAKAKPDTGALIEQSPRITQSILLGAIPGRDPRLTMIAQLSYPDNHDTAYPGALKTFGNRFSVLSPDEDMVQKMLYVAEQPPLVPSPDFWTNGGTASPKNRDTLAPEKKNLTATTESKKNMPDVTGKSLRAGLQVLQHYNLEIKLVGNGRIISQHPAAGTELKNGTECILKMQQEI
jgi:hypothetical protein